MNLGQAVAAVRAEGGIDASEEVVKGWVNDRYADMVARARWRMAVVVISVTVEGQARYEVSDDIVDVESLQVGGVGYEPVGAATLFALHRGERQLRAGRGVFSSAGSATGEEQIALYPFPDVSGVGIVGLVAMVPVPLSDDSAVPKIPVDLHGYLRDGVMATGLALMDERLPEADRFEARFEKGVELLGARKYSRLSHGPTQIQVAGIHY